VIPVAGRSDDMLEQPVPRRFHAAQELRFSCHVKTRALKGWAMLVATVFPEGSPGPPAWHGSTRIAGDHDWMRLTVDFPVPEGFGEVRVRLCAGGSAGEVWFDDAAIEELPAAAVEPKVR